MSNKAKELFIQNNWNHALAAQQEFGINPIVVLAQSAHESAWGSSYSAKNRLNYFGITAGGGSPNAYWSGEKSTSTKKPYLIFRVYDSAKNGFLDFGRLIKNKYTTAFSKSYNVAEYAKAIAYSPYIAEKNGDNRPAYQSFIIENAALIESYVKDKGLPQNSPAIPPDSPVFPQIPPTFPQIPSNSPKLPPRKFPIVPIAIGGVLCVSAAAGLYFYNRNRHTEVAQQAAVLNGISLPFVVPFWAKVAISLGVLTIGTAIVVHAANKAKDKKSLPPAPVPAALPPVTNDNHLVATARAYLGTKEFSGSSNNPAILAWAKKLGITYSSDSVPWCALFVGYVLKEAGLQSLKTLRARDYLKLGTPTTQPQSGDIVIFWRDSINSGKGHVGVISSVAANGLTVISGNDGDTVTERLFDYKRVLGYRKVA